MYHLLKGDFTFDQTQAMEAERVKMGWHEEERPAYVKCWYEEPVIWASREEKGLEVS